MRCSEHAARRSPRRGALRHRGSTGFAPWHNERLATRRRRAGHLGRSCSARTKAGWRHEGDERVALPSGRSAGRWPDAPSGRFARSARERPLGHRSPRDDSFVSTANSRVAPRPGRRHGTSLLDRPRTSDRASDVALLPWSGWPDRPTSPRGPRPRVPARPGPIRRCCAVAFDPGRRLRGRSGSATHPSADCLVSPAPVPPRPVGPKTGSARLSRAVLRPQRPTDEAPGNGRYQRLFPPPESGPARASPPPSPAGPGPIRERAAALPPVRPPRAFDRPRSPPRMYRNWSRRRIRSRRKRPTRRPLPSEVQPASASAEPRPARAAARVERAPGPGARPMALDPGRRGTASAHSSRG